MSKEKNIEEQEEERVHETEPAPENANDGEKLSSEDVEKVVDSENDEAEAPADESGIRQKKSKEIEIKIIDDFEPKPEMEVLREMWSEYYGQYQKDQVLNRYMQSIFVINRGKGMIGQELGQLQAQIKGKVQILNYLSTKMEYIKKYEQDTN